VGRRPDPEKKPRLAEATLALIRKKGYADTSVEDICQEAGLTRGSFFFYAKNKEDMALAALELYVARFHAHFKTAKLAEEPDPVRRVGRYLDACTSFAHSPLLKDGCFLGVLAEEISVTHPRLRVRVQTAFDVWTTLTEGLLVDALRYTRNDVGLARSLAPHVVGIVEGSLLLARVHRDRDEVDRSIEHLRSYLSKVLGKSVG
jgi:TetR/AcrR family transcriptional repressor of nem operon